MYISIITVLIALVAVGIPTTTNVSASQEEPDETQTYVKEERELESGFYREDGYPKDTKNRPAINSDFDPDESCHFDVYQLKCIPGANQECPEGFGNNDNSTCFPSTDCPKGYHWTEDDETGQCYPNDKGCEYDDYTFTEDKKGCVQYKMDCDCCNGEERTDGITVCDEPDHPGYKFCKSD
jgi:hypothetical protein